MAVRRNYENVRFADLTHNMNKMELVEGVKTLATKPVSH